ncbi:MAG: decarboxylating 6-phosphogluconate dehydrogenase [Desulfomonile tiedjei]|uniref:Decarboxylating 6-phosphogluconate dehydrogenase n=1 Tax=Desulfomonile tiedjei TaxID=2358 RepID=A0A9D6V2Q1_9BACT|nr:decarboxylating 6-phosphogluconate dehydrogenase [Desulfomonile tiedjei]
MKLAMVGLGRMGMNMARRLIQTGHEVVAYNRTGEKIDEIVKEGAIGAYALADLTEILAPPRTVWLMLPAGRPVDEHLDQLNGFLSPGDIVLDGGNTHFKDDVRRQAFLSVNGIHFMDVGVSGGIWGLKEGYCLMIGGDPEIYKYLEPVFKSLAPEDGYLYCGQTGAGHFVKMVHNAIEYGMMQAYAEGFDILDKSRYGASLDYSSLCHLWNRGSVIRSWLLELAESAFGKDPGLSAIKGYVEDSGEGRWTVEQAMETGVPAYVTALSLFARFRSREQDSFADRVLAALRSEFGGHTVLPAEEKS